MQVILLERIAKLGQMGDVVKVKDGFARNFLLPKQKALRATADNMARFEKDKAQLEAKNLERKSEAEAVSTKLDGETFVIIRSAGETGQLYGSVVTRDIAEQMTNNGFTVERSQVTLNRPIKTIGLHDVVVVLHPEVNVTVQVNVARSDEEAVRQAQGETLTGQQNLDEEDALSAEEVFETEDLAKAAEEELSEGDASDGGDAAEAVDVDEEVKSDN